MPKERLKVSHVMTTGAKKLAIFVVPNGWIKNRRTNIAHEVPTIVLLLMSSFTISRLVQYMSDFAPKKFSATIELNSTLV